MSILSDRQIKQRCTNYTRRFDPLIYEQIAAAESLWPPHDPDMGVREFSEECELRKADYIERSMVEIPEAERAAYKPMIDPFSPMLIREATNSIPIIRDGAVVGHKPHGGFYKIISCGLSSFGYDVSLTEEIRVFSNINSTVIDPKRFDERCLVDTKVMTDADGARYVILPPNSYALGWSREYFRIPRDIQVVCLGKSTYARAGAIVNTTPIEPGFEGNVVIEVSNSTSLPLMIYVNEGIAQFLFFQGSEECEVSYADRQGKYQGQTGLQLPKV
jgi:dCTP deaminase